MGRVSASRLPPALLATFALTGCVVTPPEPPPTVATFQVDATLDVNGCGYGALQIPSYQSLVGTLRGYAGENAEWQWSNQPRASAGTASTTGTYVFSALTRYNDILAPDPSIGYPGCSLQRRDELTVTVAPTPVRPVDAGVTDASTPDSGVSDGGMDAGVTSYTLRGSLITDVVPVSGSDCTPLLGANGGPWLAMPCQARIEIDGTQR